MIRGLYKNKLKRSRSFSFRTNRLSKRQSIKIQILSSLCMLFISIIFCLFILSYKDLFYLNIHFIEFTRHLQTSFNSIFLMFKSLFSIILIVMFLFLTIIFSISSLFRLVKIIRFIFYSKKRYNKPYI